MSIAPYRSVLKASREGHLGDLNATPWVFMLGNSLGWIAYSFLSQNFYVFLPNSPGLLLSIWLNIQAIKIQYENYHSQEMQTAIIAALEDQSKRLLNKQEVADIVETIIEEEFALHDIIHPTTTAPILNEDENELDTGNITSDTSVTSENAISGDDDDEEEGFLYDHNDGITTVAEAAEMVVDYASFIWDITAQKTPAPASHELLVIGICALWLALITLVAFGQGFLTEDTRLLIIGVCVNLNLIFFYGAPLSKIAIVLETKSSSSIHIPTMITTLTNGSLWFAYGLAVSDVFIVFPNGLGALLGLIQLLLCMTFPRYPRGGESDDGDGIFKKELERTLSFHPDEATTLI